MNKKQRCFVKRFAALVAALVISFSLPVSAFAASHNWPASPSSQDFRSHHGSWYVWQKSFYGEVGYELICRPMGERDDTDTVSSHFLPYNTDSRTYSYTNSSSSTTTTLLTAIPYIPFGYSGYWSELPSFPVGSGPSLSHCAYVRIYPFTESGALSSIPDIFSDTSIHFYLTSAFSSSGSSFAGTTDTSILDDFPVFVPNSLFVAGSKTDSSSSHSGFSLVDGATNFWATPSNGKYVDLSSSHTSSHSMLPFAQNFTIPSSELGFVFFKYPGTGYHPYNTEFDIDNLKFSASLWVPAALLPADVAVGDWISQGTMDKLQDQLVKDFDIDSDTLKNSKDNLNSWNSTSSVDSDVASGASGLLGGLFQNLGTFLFSVSLLCFGAVVLRMLIRKAVDG